MSNDPLGDHWAALTHATIIALALGVCALAASADLTLDNPARSAKFVAWSRRAIRSSS